MVVTVVLPAVVSPTGPASSEASEAVRALIKSVGTTEFDGEDTEALFGDTDDSTDSAPLSCEAEA